MKKFLVFVLSLVCGAAIASCAGGNGGETKNAETVSLTDKEITVYVGETYQFTPSGADSYAYTTSDESVARINKNGVLTGISDGTAFIDVSSGEAATTCRVNVIRRDNYIRLNAGQLTAAAGSDVTLTAEVILGGKLSDGKVKFSYEFTESFTAERSGHNRLTVSLHETGSYLFGVSYGTMTAQCTVKSVNESAEELAMPDITVEDCKTVCWNAVENADCYEYSVNGGDWTKTADTFFDAQSVTDALKPGEIAVFAVKATSGENDYDTIDSMPSAEVFSHDYQAAGIPEYTCVKAGKADFTCTVCGRTYTEEGYLAEHRWKDGACEACHTSRTKKVSYSYDKDNDCYYVVGADAGYDSEDLYIRAEYDDGANGSHAVKYIGYGAFKSNKTIRRVILPESMTEFVDADARFNTNKILKDGKKVSSPLRGQCFDDCSNLEYVSMKGITELRDIAQSYYAHWNFRDCYNLKQVIVGNGFYNTGATFMRWDNTPKSAENRTDIYVYGEKVTAISDPQSYPVGFDVGLGNNSLLTGDVLYKSAVDGCYKWRFADDGETIITDGKHDFNAKGKCRKCGARNGYGVKYEYSESASEYYVSDNQTLNEKEVNILAEYTDGIHGTHPVTFVKNGAFKGNSVIEKITFPESVTALDGDVFNGCSSLVYVSMPGVTKLPAVNLKNTGIYTDGADVVTGNNFINCIKLKTLVVNADFSLYDDQGETQQQFIDWRFDSDGQRITPAPCVDIYSLGTFENSNVKAVPSDKNILLTGVIYYKGDLSTCRRWRQDEDGEIESSARNHSYDENGVCTVCGDRETQGVTYAFDGAQYYVAGYTGEAETVKVFATYNDGKNGEHAVKYVGARAFENKTTLKKVILPACVDSLEGWAFAGCSNLEYVSAEGVKNLDYASSPYGSTGRDHNFRNCVKLKVVIVGEGFTSNVSQFGAADAPAVPVLDLYVKGADGATRIQADNMLTGNVYYYSETEKAGCWHYADETAVPWSR